jgi:hypothetical protein
MRSHNTARDWMRLLYFLSQNVISFIGVVLTTSSAVTMIAFWVYDFMLPGPSHPYVGILLFLILPGLFVLGLLLIPIGILRRRRKLRAAGELPTTYPEIDLKLPMVRNSLMFVAVATGLNVLIFTYASYKGRWPDNFERLQRLPQSFGSAGGKSQGPYGTWVAVIENGWAPRARR